MKMKHETLNTELHFQVGIGAFQTMLLKMCDLVKSGDGGIKKYYKLLQSFTNYYKIL